MTKPARSRTWAFALLAVVACVSVTRGDEVADKAKLLDPSIFDRRFYAHHNLDLGAAGLTTKEQLETHWLDQGCREGRQASPTFDARSYLADNADLVAAFGTDTRAACIHFVDYGRGEGRSGTRAVPHVNDLSLEDPNVSIYSPANANMGSLRVDPAQGDSSWRVNQWASADPIDPTLPQLTYVDPRLGSARAAFATSSKRFAVFPDGSCWTYELASAGGVNNAAGGSNIFLSADLPAPRAVEEDTRVDFDFALRWMQVVKTQAFDPVNVGQCFVGLLIRNRTTNQVIFMQKVIAEANGTTTDAHVDAGTNSPLWSTALDQEGALFKADDTWHHGRIWLQDDVIAALGATYASPQGPVTINDRDPANWSLTSIYVGLETAGQSSLTVQLRGVDIR